MTSIPYESTRKSQELSKPNRPGDTGNHVPPLRREALLGIRALGDDLIEYAERLVTEDTK